MNQHFVDVAGERKRAATRVGADEGARRCGAVADVERCGCAAADLDAVDEQPDARAVISAHRVVPPPVPDLAGHGFWRELVSAAVAHVEREPAVESRIEAVGRRNAFIGASGEDIAPLSGCAQAPDPCLHRHPLGLQAERVADRYEQVDRYEQAAIRVEAQRIPEAPWHPVRIVGVRLRTVTESSVMASTRAVGSHLPGPLVERPPPEWLSACRPSQRSL